jgi:hypothetical protein
LFVNELLHLSWDRCLYPAGWVDCPAGWEGGALASSARAEIGREGEPSGKVRSEIVEVVPRAAKADVSIGANEVLRRGALRSVGGQPTEDVVCGVDESIGDVIAGQMLDLQSAAAALPDFFGRRTGPAAAGPAKKQAIPRSEQLVVEIHAVTIPKNARVGQPIAGARSRAQSRTAFGHGATPPVANAELRHEPECERSNPPGPEDPGEDARNDGASQPARQRTG